MKFSTSLMNSLKQSWLSELRSAMVNSLLTRSSEISSYRLTSWKRDLKMTLTYALLSDLLQSVSQSSKSFLASSITSVFVHITSIIISNSITFFSVINGLTLLIHKTEQNFYNYLFRKQPLVMSIHIVSQIKRGVDEVRSRQYSAQKQKKELKYYSLYLKQIVTIQRCFRKFLIAKTNRLQEEISKQLTEKEFLHFRHKRLTQQIREAKERREKLRYSNIHKMIQAQKENISVNIREMIKNVINCADNYAKNAAVSKLAMSDVQNLRKEEKEIRAQVKELELEKQCYERRIANWNQKLKELRERIMQQSSIKTQIEKQLASSS